MTTKRRSMSGMGKGLDAFFQEETAEVGAGVQVGQSASPTSNQSEGDEELERATFYLRPSQHETLEELRMALRRAHVRTNKSELVREAIDLLAEQELALLVERLRQRRGGK